MCNAFVVFYVFNVSYATALQKIIHNFCYYARAQRERRVLYIEIMFLWGNNMKALTYLEYIHAATLFTGDGKEKDLWDFLLLFAKIYK